jgi:hypothetical protein
MRASKVNSNLAMLLLGDVGTRKSEIALESTKLKRPDGKPMRVLYIDCENGSIVDRLARFEKDGVNLDNLEIRYTQSLNEVEELIEHAKSKEPWFEQKEDGTDSEQTRLDSDSKPWIPDFIVVDGLKILYDSRQQTYLASSVKRAKVRTQAMENVTSLKKEVMIDGAKLEPADYQKLGFDGAKLIMDLVGSGCHFVVTCFAKNEMVDAPELGKDSFGNIMKKPTGKIITDGFKGMLEYCKTVMVLSADDFGEIHGTIQGKDRTETFKPGTVIDNPHLMLWQNVILKSNYVVENHVEESINKDSDALIQKENPAIAAEQKAEEAPKGVKELIFEIDKLMGTDAIRKKHIAVLKENGLGNYKNVSDIPTLNKYIEILKHNS